MSKRILVVEDEQDLVKVLHMRLADAGYEVFTAKDGVEGLEKAKEEKPDLILLDVMMPRMHGLDTLQKLKQESKTRSIPVVILTARDDEKSVSKARELGAAGYTTKPFNFEALLDAVKRNLT